MANYLCGHKNPRNNNGYRRCCYNCWKAYDRAVRSGKTTWEKLIAAGKCGLSQKELKNEKL